MYADTFAFEQIEQGRLMVRNAKTYLRKAAWARYLYCLV